MDRDALLRLLSDVRDGRTAPDAAAERLATLGVSELAGADENVPFGHGKRARARRGAHAQPARYVRAAEPARRRPAHG